MTVESPTPEQLRAVAQELGKTMSDADIASNLATIMPPNFLAYDAVEAMPDYLPPEKHPRAPGYRPEGKENKYNAWYVKTTVKGASSGKLAGKTAALKDDISLAGVPMTNGATTLEGYTPDINDAIVTRILDAGGHQPRQRRIMHNPWKMGYSAGGSFSGSAALLAAGEVDMAIGGDLFRALLRL
jgi:amidase